MARNSASAVVARPTVYRSSAPAGAGGKWLVVDAAGCPAWPGACRATSTGPAGRDVDDDDLLVSAGAVARGPTPVCPSRCRGTEYWPSSKVTIGVFAGTDAGQPERDRVRPSRGSGAAGPAPRPSISTGARRVTRCTRALTWSRTPHRPPPARRTSRTRRSRFVSVGTRSALAIFTVDSDPPLEAGSAGSQVCTVTP